MNEITEVEAIGALLAYLPRADVAELLVLGRTCPASEVAEAAERAASALERAQDALHDLRDALADVVASAHGEALAAEKWIESLEGGAPLELANAS